MNAIRGAPSPNPISQRLVSDGFSCPLYHILFCIARTLASLQDSPNTTTTTTNDFLPLQLLHKALPYPTTTTTIMSTPRRVPPPCWTHDETIALISSFNDKWLSRSGSRGNLSASEWEAVATDVTSKSSTQCRHKMEKLRKRYRSEKQKHNHHAFVSSWVLFPLLDDIEARSSSSFSSFSSPVPPKKKKIAQTIDNSDSVPDFGNGISIKTLSDRNSISQALRAKSFSKVGGSFNADHEFYRKSRAGSGVESLVGQNLVAPQEIRSRSYSNVTDSCSSKLDFDENVGGFPVRTLGERNLVPPGFEQKNSVKIGEKFSPDKHRMDYAIDKRGGNSVNSRISPSPKNSNFEFKDRNVVRKKREVGSFAAVVSAIKMLGEEYVKVETMKMEMAMEIEKMRMEMELKRNEVILESHKLAVEAFLNAMFDRKKKKVKVVSVDS
ncbi:hypothetical protein SO802_034333 [Lithocarpus litseifolius]|uniref:Myb-like domain-containing protein n=1 Tax=Lithocarpus litseifolius TaxID=425828 RepID=A0AAW2BHA7_9ROSI